MFVVAGVTGNTGSVVAEALLKQRKAVRAVVRDAAKAAGLRARGAEVAVARLDDLFAEMNAGIDGGRVDWARGQARAVRGKVSVEATLRRLLGR